MSCRLQSHYLPRRWHPGGEKEHRNESFNSDDSSYRGYGASGHVRRVIALVAGAA